MNAARKFSPACFFLSFCVLLNGLPHLVFAEGKKAAATAVAATAVAPAPAVAAPDETAGPGDPKDLDAILSTLNEALEENRKFKADLDDSKAELKKFPRREMPCAVNYGTMRMTRNAEASFRRSALPN